MSSATEQRPQRSADPDGADRASRRGNVLDAMFDLIDYRGVLDTIEQWRGDGRREYIAISNPHSLMLCRRDRQMRAATHNAALIMPDGAGIIMAARMLSYAHCGRVTGPTLMLRLCDWGRERGYKHYFYGGAEGVADRLAENLAGIYPGLDVAGTYCPPFRGLYAGEDEADVARINESDADILWVGLGAPKQEKWMHAHAGRIEASAMIGVGAAFDFHSGNVPWTPPWIRSLGMEWLFRLARNPKRMWRRNVDSVRFTACVLRQAIARRRKRVWPAHRG